MKRIIQTDKAPQAIGPYSQAVETNGTLYISGQVPINPEKGKIIEAFKDRDWNEIKSTDSWVIFKVMAEMVEGFEKLAKIGPCVSVFGSARTKPDHKYSIVNN